MKVRDLTKQSTSRNMERTIKVRRLGTALAVVLPLAWGVGFSPTAEARFADPSSKYCWHDGKQYSRGSVRYTTYTDSSGVKHTIKSICGIGPSGGLEWNDYAT